MSMIIKNVNSNFIHKIDMRNLRIFVSLRSSCIIHLYFSTEEQLSIIQETLFMHEKPFLWPTRFLLLLFFWVLLPWKKNQLSELACLTNLTISVMKDNAFKQDIKSNFFSSLKAVLYQFWPYKLYDNYMVLTLT